MTNKKSNAYVQNARIHASLPTSHYATKMTLACWVSSDNLPQFDCGEFPYHSPETKTSMTLNGPTSGNPASMDA